MRACGMWRAIWRERISKRSRQTISTRSSQTLPAVGRRSRSIRTCSLPPIPRTSKPPQFTIKIRDVSEFLADLGLTAPLRAVPLRVTYQDSCHLAHGQKIREAPRKLIRAVPGVELIEMQLADQCCGSAGVYNVTETEASLELLASKMDSARGTKAQAIVTANPGMHPATSSRRRDSRHGAGSAACSRACSTAPFNAPSEKDARGVGRAGEPTASDHPVEDKIAGACLRNRLSRLSKAGRRAQIAQRLARTCMPRQVLAHGKLRGWPIP